MFIYSIMNKHSNIPHMKTAPITMEQIMKRLAVKQASIQFRHDILASQQRINYVNEYDRLASILAHNLTHSHVDYKRLKNRHEELKKLHQQSYEESPYGRHPVHEKT